MFEIPLIKPYITPEVHRRVSEVLDSGYLTEGPVTREFERCVSAYVGCAHTIAACNCTVGLEMALRALDIGPGDEVIVPDYTYPATASVVGIVGARLVLVDVDPATMLIDFDALARAVTPRTRAVMPVSLFGNPLDYDRLRALKRKHGFHVIEDAACSLGAEYKGAKVGSLTDISVFSLHPRKFITTGEGGLITTHSDEWAAWMDSYKHFGMAKMAEREQIVFEIMGTNYKLSNVLAAIGLVQMQHIDALLAGRRALAERYRAAFRDDPEIGLPAVTDGGLHSWQSFCVFVPGRDRVLKAMRAKGIEVQIGSYALHRHPAFARSPACVYGDLPGSDRVHDSCLALPLYHDLTEALQDRVIAELRATVRAA